MSINNVIIGRIVTEKVSKMEKDNVYGFYVSTKSNKNQVKVAIEKMYGQKAIKVNIVKRPKTPRRAGKQRRVIYDEGKKIAYITTDKPLGKLVAGN
ncbi:MAG: 50S ribosomal protein L23 [Patescibacteria group bacterium]